MRNGETNYKNGHGFEFVSYIYGELDQAAQDAFEMHLVECDECTMELASYSEARLGVIEWRREDFDHLETPEMIAPWASEYQPVLRPEVRPAGAVARFIDAMVSLPMFAKAGMGLAATALAVGVVYFSTSVPADHSQDVAANKSVELKSAPVTQDASDNSSRSRFVASKNETATENSKEPATARPIKRQLVAVRTNERHAPIRRSELASKDAVPENVIKKAPRLSSADEEDDKTLRLADLLADIGTSEE
jgi:hypothetical protein